MSGIAGIYYFNGQSVDPDSIQKMAATISHRGPDRQGVWCEQNVGMANLLLQTTPESLHEELPFYDTEAQVAITADARIDNRADLLAELDFSIRDTLKISDSTLILEAYKKWGIDCHQHLIGDFAVVIWDKRNQRLFAFRDHFGIKPLYYYSSEKFFAFASEIKSLLILPDIPDQVNEERVTDFIALQDDGCSTFYKNIFTLSAAHFLISNRSEMVKKRYWSLEPVPILKLRNNNEYTEAFKEIFTESVRCRLRRTGPIGSQLSGGLDSSSITCAAREILVDEGKDQLHSFSFYFKDLLECDERKYIDPIIKQGNITPHLLQADVYPERNEYDGYQETYEEATHALNVTPNLRILKHAQKHGVNVLLDGFDGDSTVSHGTGRLIELARTMRWIKLIREAEGYGRYFHYKPAEMSLFYLKHFTFFTPFYKKLLRIKRKIIHILKQQEIDGKQVVNPFLAQDLYQKTNAARRYNLLKPPPVNKEFNDQVWHIRNLTEHGMPRILGLIDRCTAHYSIEKRYPFWDKRLIMFCLSLPAEQKLDNGYNRIIMRRAMASILPPEVCWRGGKADLSPHANQLTLNLIKAYQLQSPETLETAWKYLNKERVEQLVKSPKDSLRGNYSTKFYYILGLILWLHHRQEFSRWESKT